MQKSKSRQGTCSSVPLFFPPSSAPKCVFLETERGMQAEC